MAKWLDILGTALVVLGLSLIPPAVMALAGFWWGLLVLAAELVASGAVCCNIAARRDERGGGKRVVD